MNVNSDALKVVWHWFAMGPYHFARMSAVGSQPGVHLTVVETTSKDDHEWARDSGQFPFRLISLSDESLSATVHRKTALAYFKTLSEIEPDVIVASGYAEPQSRHAVFKYLKAHPETTLLLWSETTSFDNPRSVITESAKRALLSVFHGAVVAGSPHLRYLKQLGMAEERIRIVGGCVDNDYFAKSAAALRAASTPSPVRTPYFLYVGRFIPVKNLPMLLRAYHLYRAMTGESPHDLVLVGSGPQEAELRQLVSALHLEGVHFEGIQQIDKLPAYYANAAAFVLPSLSEPWGLVVNEAMASGLPVLASTRVGSAEDLIVPGETGYLFDAERPDELAQCFEKLAREPELGRTMGAAALCRVGRVSIRRYAEAVAAHLRKMQAARQADATHSLTMLPRTISAIEQWIR